jgi:YidC/Oxa1 family membrane protein insertase
LVVTLLTAGGGLLAPIATVLGWIMNAIYEFFHIFGIQNIALSIIVFTFIVRTLMLPLTIKQQKFTKLSSRMNPELQKIQAKYKGKKDEVSLRKQQEESQALYQKYGANPTSGCLPMLITLPIMFALYSVINNIPAYVTSVKALYDTVATGVQGTAGYQDILKSILENATNIRLTGNNDLSTINFIIDALAKFQKAQWDALTTAIPSLQGVIAESYENIKHVNNFLGLNIAEKPGWAFPGILVPVLAMVLQFVQGKQIEVKNKTANADPTANAMKSMNVVMPVMSGVFCVTLPTGIGIYWIATSVYAIIQQFFVNKYMDKIDVDELIAKNVAKASKKRSFINTPSSAAPATSMQDLAKMQTKSIDSSVYDKAKVTETSEANNGQEDSSSSTADNTASGPKSISEIANLLKNRNIEKGDK